MSTVIVSPVFPPDPSSAALYTKLLAENMSSDSAVQVVTFGTIPESVEGVPVYTISKRVSKIIRALKCAKQILSLKPTTIIVQNGPSSEFSVILTSFVSRATIVHIISDHDAHARHAASPSWLGSYIAKKATATITLPTESNSYLRPEWLPYDRTFQEKEFCHNEWWKEHLVEVNQYVQT